MEIQRIYTVLPEIVYSISFAVEGLRLTLAETTLHYFGQDFVIAETQHDVSVDPEGSTIVVVHICKEKATGEVLFLVDEYVLGEEDPYIFADDGPFEHYVAYAVVASVPPGATDLASLEFEVRESGLVEG